MKEYIVRWKPRKGGKVQFVCGPLKAENEAAAEAEAARRNGYPLAEVVSVTEYVRDLWTPIAKELTAHLEACAVRGGWRSLGD